MISRATAATLTPPLGSLSAAPIRSDCEPLELVKAVGRLEVAASSISNSSRATRVVLSVLWRVNYRIEPYRAAAQQRRANNKPSYPA